ncbi:NAD(P)H-dependent oxidoreductase [Streptomyces sp. NPDC005728]|uniref:NADPH-dependent FMN reductase n=1 Tax=Streptomyces sp. NPDC005728 TaxID=3157054 RepID=UPI00340F30E7
MTTIVLVSGSLRRDSVNGALPATVREILGRRRGAVGTPLMTPAGIPLFDEDVEGRCVPEPVVAARNLVGAAHAVVISSPSYNGSMPGGLKNVLDWLCRPWGECVLTGKPVALATASTGKRGGVEAQPELRRVLERAGAVVVDHAQVAVGNAAARLSPRGVSRTRP